MFIKERDGIILKPNAIDLDVVSWLQHAHQNLENHRDELNQLNIFPVPDADTGSNMAGTLASALEEDAPLMDRVQACLLGARGNSGTILAAWLAGFLAHVDQNGACQDLASALSDGAGRARGVLLKPEPGTMLDVMDALGPDNLAITAFEATVATSRAVRENQQISVIDSGAVGFLLVINELAQVLDLDTVPASEIDKLLQTKPQKQFQKPSEPGEVEVMFDLQLPLEKLATLRDVLPDLGNSITLTDLPAPTAETAHVAVHIHTAYAKKTIRFAERLGTLENLRTTDLTCDHHG